MNNRMLSSQDQIQRLNNIINKVEDFQKLDFQTLVDRKIPNKWSLIEVIGHMNAAYKLYETRIDRLLDQLPAKDQTEDLFKASRKNAFFIKAITPVGRKRPMKMKTMDRFKPVFKVEELEYENINSIFHTFYEYQKHLKAAIQKSRTKDNRKGKLVSAIGPIVKFHLPEAFEFLIGHMERHIIQIEELLELEEIASQQ